MTKTASSLAHFLRHGVAQGLAHRHRHHLGACGHVGIGGSRRCRRCRRRHRQARQAQPAGLTGRHAWWRPRASAAAASRRGPRRHHASSPSWRQNGDDRVHRDVLACLRLDEDLGEHALVDRLDLHRGLVGLDLGDDVAGLDRVAFLLESTWQGCPSSIVGDRAGIRMSGGHRTLPGISVRPVRSLVLAYTEER